jgi:protein-tyrosine-phosphatase/DNA-binding transcriptional ArsR family regulator
MSSRATPEFVRLASHPLRWRVLTELAVSDLRVRELVALVDQPQNLVSYHLRLLRDGGLVTATRSTFDGRDSYYHLNLDHCADALVATGSALHPALRLTPAPPTSRIATSVTVLFVCTGNSARSPVAAALLHHRADRIIKATSAGTLPGPELNPLAVRVLREEYAIDLPHRRPRHLSSLSGRRFDYLITLCDKAREVSPGLVDHGRRIHWSIPDPTAAHGTERAAYSTFARIAADIDARIRHLLPVLDTTP